jgi:SAM-dependent methyltransferase
VSASADIENLWGYGKRLQFVLGVMREAFPEKFPSAMRVLDVGCGNGSQLALPLARHGVAVTGVDTDAKSIARARELARDIPSARFENTSVNELSEGDFDVVIVSEVLEHVNDPGVFLRATVNHLAEGGVVIVTTPNGFGEFEWDSWLFRLLRAQKAVDALVRDRQRPLAATDNDSSGHIQFFTQRRLFKIFSSCGLKVWRAQAATLFAGPFAGHSLARSQRFIEWNARVADKLPMALASGWYFALRRIGPEASQ